MYLYLFSLWFISLFSSTPAAVVSTTVPPKTCNSLNSANSVNSDPFYCQQKNVLISTDDGGKTWKDMTGNLPSTAIPSCLWIDEKEWLIGAAEGLYIGNQGISMDSSRTAVGYSSPKWQQDDRVPKDVTYFVQGSQGLYLVSYRDGIYQRQTGFGSLIKVSELVNNMPFFTFTESVKGDLLGGGENGIFKSHDHGKTWQHVYENVGVNMINEYNGVLYACSWRGVLRSNDGGDHWETALPGNTTVFRTRTVDSGILALVEGQQFQGVWSPNEIMISKDKGQSWKPMFASLPRELKNVYDVVQVGSTYFAATNTGIYKSNNNGASWEKTVTLPQDKGVNFKFVVEGNTLFVLQAPGC